MLIGDNRMVNLLTMELHGVTMERIQNMFTVNIQHYVRDNMLGFIHKHTILTEPEIVIVGMDRRE